MIPTPTRPSRADASPRTEFIALRAALLERLEAVAGHLLPPDSSVEAEAYAMRRRAPVREGPSGR